MDVIWDSGSDTVRWEAGGERIEKMFPRPPLSVIESSDPPGVLVVEALENNSVRPSNAVVYNEDGSERLRLKAPELPEPSWRIGYYLAFMDEFDQLIAVYSTRVGDLKGTPDLRTGELFDIGEWR